MWETILAVLWFILPAYIANSAAVDVAGVPGLKKWTTPVDFGKTWRGKRLFGDGKTWRGLVCGVIAAAIAGYVQGEYQGWAVENISHTAIQQSLTLGFLLGLGALSGDMAASFVKRRMNLERGQIAPLLDQLDFILGAFLFASVHVRMDAGFLVAACLVTVPIHLFGNWVAYTLKLKSSPW